MPVRQKAIRWRDVYSFLSILEGSQPHANMDLTLSVGKRRQISHLNHWLISIPGENLLPVIKHVSNNKLSSLKRKTQSYK